MDTATITPPVETPPVNEPISTPPAESSEPSESIADHAEQFGPERKERDPANTGQFAPKREGREGRKHDAFSQRATPEDVAEINRLTRELRETEQRLKDKDPDANASPRIRTLKRQLAALKALEAPAPASTPSAPPVKAPVQAESQTTFTKPEPSIESFEKDPDPYLAWHKAWNRWDRERERFEESQQQVTAQQEAHAKAQQEAWETRQKTFAQSTPDYAQVTSALSTRLLPPILLQALATDDNGPALVYHLARHPEQVDELVFDTIGKPASDDLVAVMQRRLKVLASPQAAVQPDRPRETPPYIPPKPPNPVRTGPIKTAEEPPAEAGSIRDHAKYYGPKP